MMSKILHITHPEFDFSTINSNSKLLTSVIPDLPHNEYHTSLGDLTFQEIMSLVLKFDFINFSNTLFNIESDIYKQTIFLLQNINRYKTVSNFTPPDMVDFVENKNIYNRTPAPTLWVFGCSHSAGIGLKSSELKYGEILAQKLNLPLKLIARPGSSLAWSLRHLLASNILKHDTVIWQITSPTRLSVFDGTTVNEVMLNYTKNKSLLDVYNEDQLYFNQLSLLSFGVKYLREKGVCFVLTSLESNPPLLYASEYLKYIEYCYCPDFAVDRAPDGHYGPLSHNKLAHALLNHVQCVYG